MAKRGASSQVRRGFQAVTGRAASSCRCESSPDDLAPSLLPYHSLLLAQITREGGDEAGSDDEEVGKTVRIASCKLDARLAATES